MKILSIRIKNLASLEGLTEIDFTTEPLCSAGIFAITGPTGAGKSTILDALCLALYSKTPRYLQAKESGIELTDRQGSSIAQGDVRGILRDGTGEGFAEVDFVAIDNQNYRATWRIRRARDKAEGSLQGYTMALKNLTTNADVPGRKTELLIEIERLVGLNFEQFTRSVLLAQGDFTAFLKAAKDEKSALLEKLTGTHIFSEISQKIYENHRFHGQELNNLNIQREGIQTLTSEEKKSLLDKQEVLHQIIQQHEKEIRQLNIEIAWHHQFKSLQVNLDDAKATYEQAKEIKGNAEDRELLLKQVVQVQPARTWVEGRQTAEIQLANKEDTLRQLEQSLTQLQQKKGLLEQQLQKAKEDISVATKDQHEAKPLLDKARELDVQIREKTGQIVEATTALDSIRKKLESLQQEVGEKQSHSDQLLVEIKSIEKWKIENITRQPIADNQALISSKLVDAKKLLKSLETILPQIKATQDDIEATKKIKDKLEQQSATTQNELQAERVKYDDQLAVLSAIAIETLESEKAEIEPLVAEITMASAHWQILSQQQSQADAIQRKLTVYKKDLLVNEQLLTQTIDQLNTAKTARDTSLRMLDKARLAAAENVEHLRTQLVPGLPCPVCGSEKHPYVDNNANPKLDKVLIELEKEFKQNETAYAGKLADESKFQEAVANLGKSINQNEQELLTHQKSLDERKVRWMKYSLYAEASTIVHDKTADWLAHRLKEKKERLGALQNQIQAYAEKKKTLEAVKEKISHLEQQLNENKNHIKDAERALLSSGEKLDQLRNKETNFHSDLAVVENILSGYFVAKDWFDQWKANADNFLKRIADFAEKWKTNNHNLDQHTQKQKLLAEELRGMQRELQGLAEDVTQKVDILAGLNSLLDGLRKSRGGIFNGEEASTVEARLHQRELDTQKISEDIKTAADQLQTQATRAETQKEKTAADILEWEKKQRQFSEKILQWLHDFNTSNGLLIDEVELTQLLSHTHEWIELERAALREMDDAITKAQSVLRELDKQIEQLDQRRISERKEDEVNELLHETKVVLQEKNQEHNQIGFQLTQDAAYKLKIGALLAIIEAKALVVENWAKLNDIIGSADGKKFRQIAQEYTLDVLLSYTNVHLEILSKRYLLQRIPNTLGLQVLDQDMGDEVRTVFSLSGGESFLVSLALALGLASLSSSRMKVESLFIDEGFGALDPVTLSIAMDALERLHNQGRKVGVISHVQEMTERIPVQIKVSKENSGRSKVEIT